MKRSSGRKEEEGVGGKEGAEAKEEEEEGVEK